MLVCDPLRLERESEMRIILTLKFKCVLCNNLCYLIVIIIRNQIYHMSKIREKSATLHTHLKRMKSVRYRCG